MHKDLIYMYVSKWALKVGAPGLSIYTFDTHTGAIQPSSQPVQELSFGHSFVDQERGLLYICNEWDLFPQVPYNTGRVYCYRIDNATGDLSLVNHRDTYCSFTSYLAITPDRKYLLSSNHSMPNYATTVTRDADGTIRPAAVHSDSLVNLFALNEDGSIGDMVDFSRHIPIATPQYSLLGKVSIPHPHSVTPSPSGKLYACCDKGDGHLYLYGVENGRLKVLSKTLTHLPGSEPRHCAFHPTEPYLFVNHEHTPGDLVTLTTFRYDENGSVEKVAVFHADVSGWEEIEPHRQQQGLCLSRDGRYLYTQVHGYNLLLTLEVDQTTGQLRQIQTLPIAGQWPRALNLSPDGRFLICCCLAGQMIVYRIESDGTLTDTGHHSFCKGSGGVSFYIPKP